MSLTDENRRRFLGYFSGAGLGATLPPGVLWGQMQQERAQAVTPEMLAGALGVAGLKFSEEDQKAMLQAVNTNLGRYEELRSLHIPNNVAPPFYFSSLVPGMKVNRTREPLRFSTLTLKRPANLEDVAFWPITNLAHLLKTRQVTSLELTEMYLGRLHKYNEKLNCVVTFLDDVARTQAKQADAEIAAGKYKGPLHGIPWGAKDIIAVKGYKTTWGSEAYKDQMLDEEASVVGMLRDAGAVLLAKLTTGELAQGDRWFGGTTRIPGTPKKVRVDPRQDRPRRLRRAGRIRHRLRNQRVDSEPFGALRRHRLASDIRAREPLWRDGAFVDAGSPGSAVPLCGGLRVGDERHRQTRQSRHERLRYSVQLELALRCPEAARGLSEGSIR